MEYAKKYVLVPDQRLSNHTPSGEQLSEFDKAMSKILNSKLDEHIKVQRYYDLLQRKISLQENNQPWTTVKEENPPEFKSPKQDPEEDYSTVILNSVPSKLKRQAVSLLQLLKAHSNILRWNKQGQITFKDQHLKDSNLADLFNLIFTNRKLLHIPAAYEFLQALREMNIPKHYIKNKQLLQYNESLSTPVKKKKKSMSPRMNVKKMWESIYK